MNRWAKNRSDLWTLGFGAFVIIVLIAGFAGWVMNIHDLFTVAEVLTGEGVLRVIGIFIVPLGAILGYL